MLEFMYYSFLPIILIIVDEKGLMSVRNRSKNDRTKDYHREDINDMST